MVITGFEKFLIKSFAGWDIMDTMSFMFYEAELADIEVFAGMSGVYDVFIDYENCLIEVYEEDEVVLTLEVKNIFVEKVVK